MEDQSFIGNESRSTFNFQIFNDDPDTLTLTKNIPLFHPLNNFPKYFCFDTTNKMGNDLLSEIQSILHQNVVVFRSPFEAFNYLKTVRSAIIICSDSDVSAIQSTFKEFESINIVLCFFTHANNFQFLNNQSNFKDKLKGGSLNEIKSFLHSYRSKAYMQLQKFIFAPINQSWEENLLVTSLQVMVRSQFNDIKLHEELKKELQRMGFISQNFLPVQSSIFTNPIKTEQLVGCYMKKSSFYAIVNLLMGKSQHPSQIIFIQPLLRNLFRSIIQISQRQKNEKKCFNCFRGQLMSPQQLLNLQQGCGTIVQSLGFASATLNFPKLLKTCIYNVIFEIQVQLNECAKSQNDYGFVCLEADQQEILFNMFSFFKIKQVKQVQIPNKGILIFVNLVYLPFSKIAHLSMDKKNPEQIRIKFYTQAFFTLQHHKSFGQLLLSKTNFLEGAQDYWRFYGLRAISRQSKVKYLQNMGKLELMKGNFQNTHELWSELQSLASSEKQSDEQSFSVNLKMGNCFYSIQNHEKSIQYLEKCLICIQNKIGSQNFAYCRILQQMSDSYLKAEKPNYERVLTFYQQLISIYSKIFGCTNSKLFDLNLAKGKVYEKIEKYSQAIASFKDCQNILDQCRSEMKNQKSFEIKKNIAEVYKKMRLFQKSIQYFQQCILIIEECSQKKPQEILGIFSQLGQIHHELGKNEISLQYYLKCLYTKKQKNIGGYSLAKTLKNIGLIYFCLGNFAQSLEHYEECKQLCMNIGGPQQEEEMALFKALLYNEIGGVYEQLGDYQQALQNYEICQSKLRSLKDFRESELFLQVVSKIGLVCDRMGQSEKAISYYKKCEKLQKQQFGSFDLSLVKTLERIGEVYLQKNENSNALKYYCESEQIQKQLEGSSHRQYTVTLRNIGLIYQRRQQHQIALNYFFKFLSVIQQNQGYENLNVSVLIDVGLSYKKINQYEKSLQFFIKSLSILQKIGENISIDYFNTLKNIGLVLKCLGRYKEALKYLERCQKQKSLSSYQSKINHASTLSEIGFIYHQLEQFQSSLSYYERAEKIEEILIANTPLFAITLNNIACVYDSMGLFQKALLYYERCLQIQKSTIGEDDMKLAETLNNIGLAYKKLNLYDRALENYQQSEKIKKLIVGQNPSYALTLNNIASLYQEMGKFQEAIAYYKKVETIELNTLCRWSLSYSVTLNNLGSVFDRLNENQVALSYYQKSLEIKKFFGENKNSIGKTLVNIGYLYKKMGFNQRAEQCYEQWKQIKKEILGPNLIGIDYNFAFLNSLFGQLNQKSFKLRFRQLHMRSFGYWDTLMSTIQSYSEKNEQKLCLRPNIDSISYAHESLLIYNDCLSTQRKMLNQNHSQVIKVLFKLSQIYCFLEDYNSVLKNLLEIQILLHPMENQKVQKIFNLYLIAYTYMRLKQDLKEIEYYQKIVEAKKLVIGEINLSFVSTLKHLGWRYTNISKNKQALRRYERSYKIQEKLFGSQSQQLLDTAHRIGNMHIRLQKYEQALRYLLFALQKSIKKIGKRHNLRAVKVKTIAEFYDQIGYYQKAMELYLQYQQHKIKQPRAYLDQESNKENLIQLESIYKSLTIYFKRALRYDKALQYLSKREEIILQFKQKHFHLGQIYLDMGSIYKQLSDYAKAEQFVNKSFLEDSVYSEIETPLAPKIHNEMGRIKLLKKEYEKALQQFHISFSKAEKLFGIKDGFTISVIQNIGIVHYLKNSFQESLQWFKKCQSIQLQYHAEQDQSYKKTVLQIGNIYFQTQQFQLALAYFEKWDRISKLCKVKQKKIVECSVILKIARIYERKGNVEKALNLLINFEKLLVRQRKLSEDPLSTQNLFKSMSHLLQIKKQYSVALSYLKKVEDLQAQRKDLKNNQALELANSYSQVYDNLGNIEMSLKYRTKAESIQKLICQADLP